MATATHEYHVLALPQRPDWNDRVAVIVPPTLSAAGSTTSYGQLNKTINTLQNCVARLGITTTSKVALVLPNGLEFVACFLAVIHQRGIAAPLNPQFKESEYKEIFSLMDPELVIIMAEPHEREVRPSSTQNPAYRAASALGIGVAKIIHDEKSNFPDMDIASISGRSSEPGSAAGSLDGSTMASTTGQVFTIEEMRSEDAALLLFTSGTTGKPKSVILSHNNLLVAIRIIIAAHELSSSDRCMIITPLFHIIGVGGSLLTTLFSGGCIVIPPSLPASFWSNCAEYRITWYHAVPTLHRLLLSFPLPKKTVPTSLRFLRSGGSDLAPDLHVRLSQLGPQLLEVYGMTETGPAVFCNRFRNGDDSSIKPLRRAQYPIPDSVDVMILPLVAIDAGCDDSRGLSKEPGVIGEICVRGKSIMNGYTNNAEANAAAFFENGFFRTGDLGTICPNGYLKLTGRIKEVINKGGEKISPTEIEHVVLSHEAVSEVACFRIPDEMYGEEIGERLPKPPSFMQLKLPKLCFADFPPPILQVWRWS